MEKFKDFLYRQNDIIIVLIILAAAALLIFSRITLIMEYPERAAAQNAIEAAQETTTDSEAGGEETPADENADGENADGEPEGSGQENPEDE